MNPAIASAMFVRKRLAWLDLAGWVFMVISFRWSGLCDWPQARSSEVMDLRNDTREPVRSALFR